VEVKEMWLIRLAVNIAMLGYTAYFWWVVGMWLYRNRNDLRRKAEKIRDAAVAAFKDDNSPVAPA
jgi:hypothetical protein